MTIRPILLLLIDAGLFELIIINTVLWVKSEKIIKKYFRYREPFRRAGIFRTPIISRKSDLPEAFKAEYFAITQLQTRLGIFCAIVLFVCGYLYAYVA